MRVIEKLNKVIVYEWEISKVNILECMHDFSVAFVYTCDLNFERGSPRLCMVYIW